MLELFDTHTHVDSNARFTTDRAEVVQRAREAGVRLMMAIGYNEEIIPGTLAFADANPGVYATVGIHPHNAAHWTPETRGRLLAWAQHPKVRAVGEIGLDYYYKDYATPAVQQQVFREQIRLARELKLPIVIHNRDAHEDVVRLLAEEGAAEVGGIMHCFTGDWAFAERCLALNFALGLGGPVTYPKNEELREVARRTPLEMLVLETDCPYLTPVPYRGKRNEPAYVAYVAETVARARGMDVAELARITTANGCRIFGITGG
jgi:TatD DNase family protein